MQNLEEYKEQYILGEIQKLEVLAIANIVNYSLWDMRQITAPFGFQSSGFKVCFKLSLFCIGRILKAGAHLKLM